MKSNLVMNNNITSPYNEFINYLNDLLKDAEKSKEEGEKVLLMEIKEKFNSLFSDVVR